MIPRKHDILYLSWHPLKDTASSFARLVNSPFFTWNHVVWNTQTLEEVCKVFQVDQNEAMIEATELSQQQGLYED